MLELLVLWRVGAREPRSDHRDGPAAGLGEGGGVGRGIDAGGEARHDRVSVVDEMLGDRSGALGAGVARPARPDDRDAPGVGRRQVAGDEHHRGAVVDSPEVRGVAAVQQRDEVHALEAPPLEVGAGLGGQPIRVRLPVVRAFVAPGAAVPGFGAAVSGFWEEGRLSAGAQLVGDRGVVRDWGVVRDRGELVREHGGDAFPLLDQVGVLHPRPPTGPEQGHHRRALVGSRHRASLACPPDALGRLLSRPAEPALPVERAPSAATPRRCWLG